MKKTPIIAGVVGLGMLGGAYFGGLYVSGTKAMNALRQMVVSVNEGAGAEYLQLQEERGLFSSTAHIVVQDPITKSVKADSKLTFHHGVFSTDIDGKLMVNNPLLRKTKSIEDNGGFDVLGHVNTFGSKGNFVQVAISNPINDKKELTEDNKEGMVFRAEQGVALDQPTLDKLRSVIAKGMNGQSPVGADGRGDGKESTVLISLRVKAPGNNVDINVPVLYQKNSRATDASMFMSVNYNGNDVLKPYGIDAIDGVSHQTNDIHKMGSYARFDMHGALTIPSRSANAHSPFIAKLAGLGLLTEINENEAYTAFKADSLDMRGDNNDRRNVSTGPVSFKVSIDSSAYKKLLDDIRAWPSMRESERLASQKAWQTYLPDLHLEMQNLHVEDYNHEGSEDNVSTKNTVFSVTRDPKQLVTRVAWEAHDIHGINGHEAAHVSISESFTLDQSIVDASMGILAKAQQAQFKLSDEQKKGIEQDVLTLLKKSPHIVLNRLQVSNSNWPQAIDASGEVHVLGDTISSLQSFNPASIVAHLEASGLPSDQIERLDKEGVYGLSSDKPVTVDFRGGILLINGILKN